MFGKSTKFGLTVLALMVVLIIILHFFSIHIHTDHTTDVPHSSHSSLKTKSLEDRRNKPRFSLQKALSTNSTLQQLHNDLLILRDKLKKNEFSRHIAADQPQSTNTRVVSPDQHLRHQEVVPLTPNDSASKLTTEDGRAKRVKPSRAVIFTMDTIPSYEANSHSGGASGELIIRHALEEAFQEFGVSLLIIRSDEEFDRCDMHNYDIILLDSWTWAMKGWKPKRNIRGHESKLYILDFFGTETLRGNSLHLPPRQILTAFKSPWNSFLGYYIHPERIEKLRPIWQKKSQQGVIWGKDPKHYDGKHELLQRVASVTKLISTSTVPVEHHSNIEWVGHLTSDQWFEHLARSKFLLGMGNPLLGPSAVDAVALGCMFIDPIYDKPAHTAKYISQHPYLHTAMAEYVCTYREGNKEELVACVKKALTTNLEPKIPEELTRSAYMQRVKDIFGL